VTPAAISTVSVTASSQQPPIRQPRRAFEIYELGMQKKIPANVCREFQCLLVIPKVPTEGVAEYINKSWADMPPTEKAGYIDRLI
jgi:hypothetical protein